MAEQGDLFAAPGRRGMRSNLVDKVRRDFADLADDPQHAGMQDLAVKVAHSVWASHETGDFRGVELLSAELRKLYKDADDVRRAAQVAAGGGTIAQVLALAAPTP